MTKLHDYTVNTNSTMQQSMQLKSNQAIAGSNLNTTLCTQDATTIKDASEKLAIDGKTQPSANLTKAYTGNVPAAALTISSILGNHTDASTLINQLNTLAAETINGDTTKIEGALIMQSKTLSVIFSKMVENAVNAKFVEQFKVYMDVALKSQNQSRKTLLALSAIQHPQQATIVKQQNIAVNQQVNNSTEKLNS